MEHSLKASPYTRLFWNEALLSPEGTGYNIAIDQTIRGPLDPQKLSAACRHLVSDHVLLNSHLEEKEEGLCWVENPYIQDLQLFQGTEGQRAFVEQPFLLEKGPLYRFALFRRADDLHDVILVLHHALLDGSCGDEFLSLVSSYYGQRHPPVDLPSQRKKIRRVNQELEERVARLKAEGGANFWQKALEGYPPFNPFPYIRLEEQKGGKVGEHRFSVLKSTLELSTLKTLKTTLFTVLSSVFGAEMCRYCSSDKVSVGYPVAIKGTQDFIFGGQINTVLLPVHLGETTTLRDLIEASNAHIRGYKGKDKLSYKELPLHEIMAETSLSRINLMFTQTHLKDTQLMFEGCAIRVNTKYNVDLAGFDFLLEVSEHPEELHFRIKYDTSLLTEAYVQQQAEEYVQLLRYVMQPEHVDRALSSLSLLTPAEHQQMVVEWNQTDATYPKDKTVVDLFEEQVLTTPHKIAVVFEGQKLTYQQLNAKANQLARHLRASCDVQPDTLIALCMERGLEMIVGILGVMKAGGAYVPIDPAFPSERIAYMLEDTRSPLLLTQSSLVERFKGITKLPLLTLDTKIHQKDGNSSPKPAPGHLAYVIYTSGTTGKPKGVMVEHRGVVNTLTALGEPYAFTGGDKVTAFTSYVFDVSVSEIFVPLIRGAELHILSDASRRDPEVLSQYLLDQGVTHTYLPPVILSALPQRVYPDLKTIIYAGEPCDQQTAGLWSNKVELYNIYGPTEATIYCLSTRIRSKEVESIGRPLPNTKAYVLDPSLNPVPCGVVGELHIGGTGLARGYLNRAELTAEKFIPNPFATEEDKKNGYTRLYKTGDLVRWRFDGTMEYMGRNDFQVKIRGYRIELGEIEQALSSLKGVEGACVLVKEKGGHKHLVGYVVCKEAFDKNALLHELEGTLPSYMVPSTLVPMEAFPLTINGKLDRKALPSPDLLDEEHYVAPSTEVEKRIALVYGTVLDLPASHISRSTSFFRMGGNSMLSLRLKQKLSSLPEFAQITIADLFKHDSVQKLAQSLTEKTHYRIQKSKSSAPDIAIIGMSGACNGAKNLTELWNLVVQHKEGSRFCTKEECQAALVPGALLNNPHFVPLASHLEATELFDPLFWGMSPNEAKQLDPQIRKFLEHCWSALSSSGHIKDFQSLNVGVFSGSGYTGTYLQENILKGEAAGEINPWKVSVFNSKDSLATQVAYLLNLIGPANSINTACSTGLVSVVEACKNLCLGVCDLALAGGVSLRMPEEIGYVYQEGMISSKDGHCRPFDKEASGTVMGSGVGVVVLKRLEEALADSDTVFGVLRGYATNNDGNRKTDYTAPSVIGQTECLLSAHEMAGITGKDLSYIECHGTATPIGDPIEVQALRDVFTYQKHDMTQKSCVLGSVKANIGHLDSAAGILALIKVCQMLQHNMIPGQTNFQEANPDLALERTCFEVIKENRPWASSSDQTRNAGISSFGVGGTNAHVVLSAPPPKKERTGAPEPHRYIFPMSARSARSVRLAQEALLTFLERSPQREDPYFLRDVATTLQERRQVFPFRSAVAATTVEELTGRLQAPSLPIKTGEASPPLIFMFPGHGPQYPGMGEHLYRTDPLFRSLMDSVVACANPHLDRNLLHVLYPKPGRETPFHETQWTQLCAFALSFSLTRYLQELGLTPSAYLGHSSGEYVAATLCGVFTLEEALKIIIKRGSLMRTLPEGRMIAVQSDVNTLEPLVTSYGCEISLINSPEDVVVSGRPHNIDKLTSELSKRSISLISLPLSLPFHSEMTEGLLTPFERSFEKTPMGAPHKDMYVSNVTGQWAGKEVSHPSYWARHLRQRVEFAKSLQMLGERFPDATFVEVGPGKSLGYFVKRTLKDHGSQALQLLPSVKEAPSTPVSREDLLAKLWSYGLLGAPNSLDSLKEGHNLTDLPTYQFEHKALWLKRSSAPIQNDTQLLPRDSWLSTSSWRQSFPLSETPQAPLEGPSLLFLREGQLPPETLSRDSLCVYLSPKEKTLREEGERTLFINPHGEESYEQLATWIAHKKLSLTTLFHLATLQGEDLEEDSLAEDSLSYGFFSLFLIKQHLLSSLPLTTLLIATRGLMQLTGNDPIDAFNGAMVGALRNIRHETLGLEGIIVDLGTSEVSPDVLLEIIRKKGAYAPEDPLALRFNQVWQQEITPCPLPEPAVPLIKDKDVVLMTGGLGGIALSLAEFISRHHTVTFVLVSRRGLSEASKDYEKKEALLSTLRERGCSVDRALCDLGDKESVKALIERVARTHGPVHGVIHGAGVFPLSVDQYSLKAVQDAFRGKVYGIFHLLNHLDPRHLTFVRCLSSLASVVGDINRIEYCASNSFLDYLCFRSDLPALYTLNLPGWGEMGMAKVQQNTPEDTFHQMVASNALDGEEGKALLYSMINAPSHRQIMISKIKVKALRDSLKVPQTPMHDHQEVRLLETEATETEQRVAQAFCKVLGLEELSLKDDFFHLGGTSLSSVHLLSVLKKDGLSTTLHDITHNSTVSGLARTLGSENKEIPILVPLKVRTSSPCTLFFFHPVGGTVMMYAPMAERLPMSCVGLQNPNVYGDHTLQLSSLHELAERYLQEVLSYQQEGAYYLCGSSLGGTLAFEVGRLLTLRGKEVRYVGMFDTWAEFSNSFRDKEGLRTYFKEQKEYEEQLKDLPDAKSFVEARWELMQWLLKYTPEKTDLPVFLYKATQLDSLHSTNKRLPDCGWGSYLEHPARLRSVEGDHTSIHQEPGLSQLIEQVSQDLERLVR